MIATDWIIPNRNIHHLFLRHRHIDRQTRVKEHTLAPSEYGNDSKIWCLHLHTKRKLKKEGQTVIAQRIRAWKFEETITNTKSLSNIYYSNVTMHDVYKFKLCNLLTNGHGLWLASSRDIKDRNMLKPNACQ